MEPIKTRYVAALYMRLSKDDDKENESASITTQRKMLVSYAKENNFLIYDEYIDDGWSGTNFERPAFKRMIQDIEDKKINLIITKDLSRLGRDYITSGQYTEIYFPSKAVRYIAINDGYDSESQYTDIVPFKNVINEMYARDTSKKIRSAFLTKMQEGSYIGNFAPYGYKKDEKNKNQLLIDENVCSIVKKIFDMAAGGNKPSDIVDYLNSQNIPTPIMYRCQNNPHLNPDDYSKRKEWTSATIVKLLRNTVYLGHTSQKKTTKISFKSDLVISNPRDEWITVEDTHAPIIDKETFNLVRRYSQSRTCEKKGEFINVFSGIAKCADCGKNMSAVGSRKKGSPANLACGGYKLHGSSECSNHFIDYNVIYDIILKSINEQINLSEVEKQELAISLQEEDVNAVSKNTDNKEFDKSQKRKQEIDGMVEKLYEDNYKGIISDDRFIKLLDKYEKEDKIITDKLQRLYELISKKPNGTDLKKSLEQFRNLVEKYSEIKSLNQELLFKFIDRIEVEQGHFEKTENGKIKHQKLNIYYRFIGKPMIKEYTI